MDNTHCCNRKMDFNDNSITRIPDKKGNEGCHPTFHCSLCDTYYDGFTAHLPVMEKLSNKVIINNDMDKWFTPDVLSKLRRYRELQEMGVDGKVANRIIFNSSLIGDKRILLSTLGSGDMLQYEGEIVTASYLRRKIRRGEKLSKVFTISDDFVESILKQVSRDYQELNIQNSYTATNIGVEVTIDYENIK